MAGWITGGQWKPASSSAPSASNEQASTNLVKWYFGLGANMGTASDHPDGVARIGEELTALRYNSTGGEPDNNSTGIFLTGGLEFGDEKIAPRLGFSFQTMGDLTNRAFGSRTNVPGSVSNLIFTSDQVTSLKIFGIDAGVVVPVGSRLYVSPNLNLGWGKFESTNSQQLQAGPVGPNPATTVVNTDSQSSSATPFGLGWSIESGVSFNEWIGAFARFSQRTFKDVFEQPHVGRLPADQTLRDFWVGIRVRRP